MTPVLIVLNAGSSSLKFQVFETPDGGEPRVVFRGLFEGLGGAARFVVKDSDGTIIDETTWSSGDRIGHEEALMHLISWLRRASGGAQARGHRAPGRPWRRDLFRPGARRRRRPSDRSKRWCRSRRCISRITSSRSGSCGGACRRSRRLPVSTRPFTKRQSEIAQHVRPAAARCASAACGATASTGCPMTTSRPSLRTTIRVSPKGRVIVAHLGNGASLCALKSGASVATTMGFSALDGLPMGTRCGAVDAGVDLLSCCGR